MRLSGRSCVRLAAPSKMQPTALLNTPAYRTYRAAGNGVEDIIVTPGPIARHLGAVNGGRPQAPIEVTEAYR